MINATCIGSDFQRNDTTTTTTNVAVSLMQYYNLIIRYQAKPLPSMGRVQKVNHCVA